MAKDKYLALGNGRNYKLLKTVGKEFYPEVNQIFKEKITKQNLTIAAMEEFPDQWVHFFKNGEYIGFLNVIEEEEHEKNHRRSN